VPPGWVRNLEDYCRWSEAQLDGSGGYLVGSLHAEVIPDLEDRIWELLLMGKQRLHFHDETYLDFELSVDADLIATGYKYHYSRGIIH
jgi:hypothetical protein